MILPPEYIVGLSVHDDGSVTCSAIRGGLSDSSYPYALVSSCAPVADMVLRITYTLRFEEQNTRMLYTIEVTVSLYQRLTV